MYDSTSDAKMMRQLTLKRRPCWPALIRVNCIKGQISVKRVFSRNDNEILKSFNYLAKRATPRVHVGHRFPLSAIDVLPMILTRIRSLSEGSLQPAYDAVAEVFCDVEGRHLV